LQWRNGRQEEGEALSKVQFFCEICLQTKDENLCKVEAGRNPQLGGGREKEMMSFILNICTNHGTEEK